MGEAEDALGGWLEERGVEEAWDLAPTLAAAGVDEGRLERLAGELGAGALAGGLAWLAATLEITGLVEEVRVSARRISELVGAMKEYAYPDRGAPLEVDVLLGLEYALTILGHELRGAPSNASTRLSFRRCRDTGGELNQVWTNILDSAADAVHGNGRITSRAFQEGD